MAGGQKETRGPTSAVPCRFFLRGACLKGDACPFLHDDIAVPAAASTAGQEDPRPDIHRDIGGALVTFGDGAVVAKVSFACDFSAVRVKPLPRDTDAASVVDLLAELGFDVSTDSVRIPPPVDDCCCADIRVQDAQFARRLCAAMAHDDGHDAVPIPVSLPQSTSAHRVDAKKVHCSWHKPTTAPPSAEAFDPGDLSYDADLPLANTLIESLLLQAGPLERWEGASDRPGKRFKAKARFVDEADARQAVNSLNNTPLPFNKNGRLTAQLVHSARLKVSALVFDAVEHDIAAHEQAWRGQHLLYTAYPPVHGFRVLRIEGGVSGDVAAAAATLHKILGGELLAVGGKAIWTDSFAGNGPAYRKIKEVERRLGIVIVRDKRKRQLRVLGAPSRHDEARRALTELVKQDSSSVFVIELNVGMLAWAFDGGFRAVAAAIGSEKVTLDMVSSPRRVLVTGSEASFHTARDILSGGQGAPPEAGSSTDCAICWTEAESPVRTACGHTYCSGCFEDLCLAGTWTDGPVPSVLCQGDGGRCGQPLPLAELQEHLSSAALEDLVEASFAAYVARHPDELRYCPTPDCGQLYRVAKPSTPNDSRLFTCPACLVATCTCCHGSYDGLTCAETRDLDDRGQEALQEAKLKLGIKDCPRCGTMIEKSSGCNHLTCTVCKAHICWVCMKTFAIGKIYDHMTQDHGGIGL